MKTLFSLQNIMAILGLALASTFAQTQSSTSYIETSKFIGRPVKSAQGDQIGTVKDIVLDRSTGCLAYTVLSTTGGGGSGTRISGGGKMVAVPWGVYSPSTDPNVLTVTVERDRIYNAPVFDYARIEEYSRPDYVNNVYSYYGVTQGAAVGVSGGTSTTTTGATTTSGATTTTGAATGVNTTGGAAASPATGASAAGSAAPNTAEGRRAHPGAAAAAGAAAVRARETETPTPYSRGGTSPSKERTPSAKQKQQPTPSSRTDAERSETGNKSETGRAPTEGTATGEKTKGSTRERSRSREGTSPPERPQE